MRKLAVLLLAVALLVGAVPVLTTSESCAAEGLQGFQGTVTNATGAPMVKVLISARNTTTNTTLTAVSSGDGTYQLVTPPGTYNVSASSTNYRGNTTYINKVVQTGAGSNPVVLNFTMQEVLGSLHGFVTDGVAPVNGVTVFLASAQHNYTTKTVSPLGEYRIVNVQPGVYVATFTKNGYERNNTLALTIVRGVTLQENASIQAQPCKLFGKVTENGNPQEGVTVTAQGSDKVVVGTTDANGNYSVQLISDTYTVTFSKKGFDPKSVSVSLAPFEDRPLDTSIVKSVNNTATYLFGFDLSHSLMIIGLMMALATICVALLINFKVRKKPELLGADPKDDEKGA